MRSSSSRLTTGVPSSDVRVVVRSTKKTLEGNGLRHFARFTLVATHGKMVFTDTGPAFLVVVMDRNVELAPVDIEIESAAMRIRNLGEIRV